jgi:hypothetical protein
MVYQIRVAGQLDCHWVAWFGGLAVTPVGGDTLITGPVVDQSALHGLLKKVRDLGMPLVSVVRLDLGPGAADPAPPDQPA